ncbi:ATP-binding protein [Pirellulales bacterium]|nr:ATP-binding protein [Pirellulales bacterium]
MTRRPDKEADGGWPPHFSLDQERVLTLLTGDRFYSNPSAALRESILNAVDAVQRRVRQEPSIQPDIAVTFETDTRKLEIRDNGIGMGRAEISSLFTKIGASAATQESEKDAVGEFGIGVISYFMAADAFDVHTYDGTSEPIGLSFTREMLAGGAATPIKATRTEMGTTVSLHLRDDSLVQLLVDEYPHWCRDVGGLRARVMPAEHPLEQGNTGRVHQELRMVLPTWIEKSHLGPVDSAPGWDAMTGRSTISVLYRGVFVQEHEVDGLWGVRGSIDVDPKQFKPSLNREGFVGEEFKGAIEAFLREVHPVILEQMATVVGQAAREGKLSKWNEGRWANLWLSVPRKPQYADATAAWDRLFRTLPAFEVAQRDRWSPCSFEDLLNLPMPVYLAPHAHEKSDDSVKAAVRLLRNSKKTVIRGIRKDKGWLRYAGASFGTTADLVSNAFQDELPELIPINAKADDLLTAVERLAPLFTGPPPIDLVHLGDETPPALRLRRRLVINVDNPRGRDIVSEVLESNAGADALIGIVARHAYEQLQQVAAVVNDIDSAPEILSPVRRRYIRSCLA